MKSLRAREFAAIGAAVLVAAGATFVLAVVLVRRSVQHEALKTLVRQVALVAAQQRAAPAHLTSLGLFFHTQQEQLAIVTVPQAALLLPPAAGVELRAGRTADGHVQVRGSRYLYAAEPQHGRAIVLLRSAKLEASDLRPFTVAFALATAVGAIVAAITAFLLAGAVARPVRRAVDAIRALAAGERPGELPVEGSNELGELAAAFNAMALELDAARQAQRSFLLSVSHELKTPLASIRGHGEALLDGVIATEAAAEIVIAESKRLERLVRDLLDLARLDQRAFSVRGEHVDLAELAREAVSRHETEARRVGVDLAVDGDAAAPAVADADRVLQILSNLIENALRATPGGGAVTVSASPGKLVVSDTGPGLEPDELPRAFERFYLYGRRSANRGVGTGLGLAIVKELAEAMGGRTDVASVRGRGTRFAVWLPRSAEGAGDRVPGNPPPDLTTLRLG